MSEEIKTNNFERRTRAVELLHIATMPLADGEVIHPDRICALNEIAHDRAGFIRHLGGLMHDALGHIKRICGNSRTSTRRLRWIEQRADWAIEGKEYDRDQFSLPETGTSFRQLKTALEVANARIAELESRP